MRARSRRPAAPCASPAAGSRTRSRSWSTTTAPASGPTRLEKIFERFYTDRPQPELRPELRASACRSPSRSSKPMAAASGPRTAPASRPRTADCRRRDGGDERAAGAPLRMRCALPAYRDPSGARVDHDHPRLRRAGRRRSAALIRGPAGAGQIATGAGICCRRQRKAPCPSRGWSATTAFTSKRTPAGCWCGRPPALAGLLEIRGLGIRRLPYEPVAVVGLVVDLGGRGRRAASAREAANGRHRRGFACRGLRSQPVRPPWRLVLAWLNALARRQLTSGRIWADPALPRSVEIINYNGPRIAVRRKRTLQSPRFGTTSFAVQQSAYIARQALATGLRMSLNARPFVRRNPTRPRGV